MRLGDWTRRILNVSSSKVGFCLIRSLISFLNKLSKLQYNHIYLYCSANLIKRDNLGVWGTPSFPSVIVLWVKDWFALETKKDSMRGSIGVSVAPVEVAKW